MRHLPWDAADVVIVILVATLALATVGALIAGILTDLPA